MEGISRKNNMDVGLSGTSHVCNHRIAGLGFPRSSEESGLTGLGNDEVLGILCFRREGPQFADRIVGAVRLPHCLMNQGTPSQSVNRGHCVANVAVLCDVSQVPIGRLKVMGLEGAASLKKIAPQLRKME